MAHLGKPSTKQFESIKEELTKEYGDLSPQNADIARGISDLSIGISSGLGDVSPYEAPHNLNHNL